MKDFQHALSIANKRIEQLENNKSKIHDNVQQKQYHHSTSSSQGHSEVSEMKLWFLEQIEADGTLYTQNQHRTS